MDEADAGLEKVLPCNGGEDTRYGLRMAEVDTANLAVGMIGPHEGRVHLARHIDIVGITADARDEAHVLAPQDWTRYALAEMT